MRTTFIIVVALAAAGLLLPPVAGAQEGDDPAQVAVGERLFLETRFAQFFFEHVSKCGRCATKAPSA